MPTAAPVRSGKTQALIPLLAAIALLPSLCLLAGRSTACPGIEVHTETYSTVTFFADQANQIGFRSGSDESILHSSVSTNLVREQAIKNGPPVAQRLRWDLHPNPYTPCP